MTIEVFNQNVLIKPNQSVLVFNDDPIDFGERESVRRRPGGFLSIFSEYTHIGSMLNGSKNPEKPYDLLGVLPLTWVGVGYFWRSLAHRSSTCPLLSPSRRSASIAAAVSGAIE